MAAGVGARLAAEAGRRESLPLHAPVGNLISGFSAFSKSSLNIWKFTIHILLKSGLENEWRGGARPGSRVTGGD